MKKVYTVSNESYFTNVGSEYKIIYLDGLSAIIRFVKTGSVKRILRSNIPSGKIKDVYEPTRYGVGYLGDYEKPYYWKEAHQLWSNMIKRCYSDTYPKGYKKLGTTVDARWQCFERFLVDLPELKNFDKWVTKQGYQLDKDLRCPDCNVYSFETCMFVTEYENKQAGKLGKKLIDGDWVTTTP